MLYLGANLNQIKKNFWFLLANGLKSAMFLILLVAASIPLMMFALLIWKLDVKTAVENRKPSRSKEPHLSNNLSVYQRGSDSINARATSTGTGLRK